MLRQRLAYWQNGCPYALELLASIRCVSRGQAYEMERSLHALFKKHRIRGEWFKKVSMKKASEAMSHNIVNQNKTPHTPREWDDAEMALEANKHL
jgi:hypothetical protein